MLLAEVVLVEEEVEWLEKKINQLKLDIYKEKRQTKEKEVSNLKGFRPQWEQRQLRKLPSRRPNQIQHKEHDVFSISQNYENRRYRNPRERRASVGSSMEFQGKTELPLPLNRAPVLNADITMKPSCSSAVETQDESGNSRSLNSLNTEIETVNPNKLSAELIKCLISIFLKLNQTRSRIKETTNLTKNSLTCMNSKGLVSKATFSCRTPVFPFNENGTHLDPYEISDVNIRDVGPYKNFIHITISTVDATRLSECLPAMQRLR